MTWHNKFITQHQRTVYTAWDETQTNELGTFDSYEEAVSALDDHAAALDKGRPDNHNTGGVRTKIKIDKKGRLWIERAGRMVEQTCPYDQNAAICGDWCPLFNDAYLNEGLLELCRAEWLNLEVVDDREGSKQGLKAP